MSGRWLLAASRSYTLIHYTLPFKTDLLAIWQILRGAKKFLTGIGGAAECNF
jgi:hypothetical protein